MPRWSWVCVYAALLFATIGVYGCWVVRSTLAKPVVLVVQYVDDKRTEARIGFPVNPPLRRKDGSVVQWYQDEYTEPNTRCSMTLMHATDCVGGWRRTDAACERRVTAACDLLFPVDMGEPW